MLASGMVFVFIGQAKDKKIITGIGMVLMLGSVLILILHNRLTTGMVVLP